MKKWKYVEKAVSDANRCPHYWRIYADIQRGVVWCNEYVNENDWSEYRDSYIKEVASGYGYRSIFGPTKITVAGLYELLNLLVLPFDL